MKDVRAGDRVVKVRVRVSKIQPTLDEERQLTSKPNIELERKALEKRLSLSEGRYSANYLQPDDQPRLETAKHWKKTYGGTGDDFGQSIQTTEGKYIVAGGTSSFGAGGNDVYLLKIDETITTVWTPATLAIIIGSAVVTMTSVAAIIISQHKRSIIVTE